MDADRKVFEAWVKKHTEFDLELLPNGEYAFDGAQWAWQGYQAGCAAIGKPRFVGFVDPEYFTSPADFAEVCKSECGRFTVPLYRIEHKG